MTMEYLKPKNLKTALKFLATEQTRFPVIAGGTDLMAIHHSGQFRSSGIIDLWGVDELRGVDEDDQDIEVGALATHSEIVESPLINKYLPLLSDACRTIGARQIQNRGTIGGNVMNASPAGDTLPVLAVYEADVKLISIEGERYVPFTHFFTGYRQTVKESCELVAAFRFRKPASGEISAFYKIGTRKAQAISKVMGAFRASQVATEQNELGRVYIAYGSVAPVPLRLKKTEDYLSGKKLDAEVIASAVAMCCAEVTPIDDIRSTADYRRYVCGVLLKRFLQEKF